MFENENIQLTHGYFITSNGAQIFDASQHVMYSKTLDTHILLDIYHILLELENSQHLRFNAFDGITAYEFDADTIADHIDILLQKDLINLCVFSKNNDIQDVASFVQATKNIDASIMQNTWYVDVLPKDISKAFAFQKILELLHEEDIEDTTMAIGDSWNDVCMFEVVDHSFTFYDSPTEVKEKANHLVHHFYEAIEQMDRIIESNNLK